MKFKFSLLVLPEVSGVVIPISYQPQLAKSFSSILMEDAEAYAEWLENNGLQKSFNQCNLYVVSNLYIPKIVVIDDRLKIGVPRIQFWASFLPDNGTKEFLQKQFAGKEFSIGDEQSSVRFSIAEIEDVSPVVFNDYMEYQSLSPVVIKAYRANRTLEYLNPNNPVFGQFIVDELIERWERFHQCQYTGNRTFGFRLLAPERRKSVNIQKTPYLQEKVVGYMIKFCLEMSPILQEFAYAVGIGDEIGLGFGYLELMQKRR